MNMKPKFRIYLALFGAFLVSSLTPLFAQSVLTPEQLTQQLRELSERSQNSASALSSIQQDVKKMSRLMDNRAMLELMQNVEELASEISQLRGEMEQQGHDITELKKRQRELYLDIDRRLRELNNGASLPAQGSAPVIESQPQQAAIKPVIEPETLSGGGALIAETNTQAAISQPSINTVTSSKEQAAYQAAFDTLKEGRYKKAKTEFKRFLQMYPNSSYAGNAQYWLGEANYVTRNFDQGIVEFNLVLSRYPTSNKIADAMLKLGYTYYEKKQFEEAKKILRELNTGYPKTTAARLAIKRLDRIRKEGH